MKGINFRNLLKKHKDDPHHLIRLHCLNKIYLTDKQLDEVIKLKRSLKNS